MPNIYQPPDKNKVIYYVARRKHYNCILKVNNKPYVSAIHKTLEEAYEWFNKPLYKNEPYKNYEYKPLFMDDRYKLLL